MNTVEQRIYHAFPGEPITLASILEDGLQPGADGCVYTANTPAGAASFVKMRSDRVIGHETVELPDGRTVTVPVMGEPIEQAYVVEIHVNQLDPEQLDISDDHNPLFFPADLVAYRHAGIIPPEAIDETMWLFDLTPGALFAK